MTTASSPARSLRTDLARITHPEGVQGASACAPDARRPTLIGWKPSTSLAGSIASITCRVSMCLGSGSCTRMPCTSLRPLSSAISASRAASGVSAGSRCSNDSIPASVVAFDLVRT